MLDLGQRLGLLVQVPGANRLRPHAAVPALARLQCKREGSSYSEAVSIGRPRSYGELHATLQAHSAECHTQRYQLCPSAEQAHGPLRVHGRRQWVCLVGTVQTNRELDTHGL